MKLFKAALGSKEQDKALSREKFFNQEHGELAASWNQRLISSGMEPDQALDQYGRRDLPDTYSSEQEHQYAMYARWVHRAAQSQFEIGKGTATRNRQIWSLYSQGMTEREIAADVNLSQPTVHDILIKLISRCHEDIRLGVCDAEKDSRQEINDWTKLQNIKRKHLDMLRSGTLAETIADSIIDSGCLIKLPFDEDVVAAFNDATAQLALAFAAGE